MNFPWKIPAAGKILYPAALLVITFAVLFPVLKNGFVDWDDWQYVVSNSALRGSWNDVLLFFPGYYHPLTTLTYKTEFVLFGLNPLPYHLTNLALHLANCVLAFYLFRMLGARETSAFLGALLFGIHPAHLEPAAWISGRKELLWGLFFFCSLIAYMKYLGAGLKKFLIYSFAFFILAVLSKPAAVVIPLALLLLDRWRGRECNARALAEKLPWFAAALAFFLLSIAPSGSLVTSGLTGFTVLNSLFSAGKTAVFYAQKLILPFKLSALYPQTELSGNVITDSIPILCVALVCVGAFRLSRRAAAAQAPAENGGQTAAEAPAAKTALGLGLFLITLLPALNATPPADRYCYVPAAGLFFAYGEFIARLYGRIRKIPLRGVVIGFVSAHLFFLGLASFRRAQVWKDSLTLWQDVLAKYPLEAGAYYGRGNAYYAAGEYDKALSDFSLCLELSPRDWKALNNRGRTFAELKAFDRATADYGSAIAVNPAEAQLFLNRGNAYFSKGGYSKAVEDYNRALALAPGLVPASEMRRLASARPK